MASVPEETMTFEAFLEWEAKQERKHYLHEGRVYAMAGAGRNHASITPVLAATCVNQLRGQPCRYRDTDTKVYVARTGSVYYPDGLIACPPNDVSESQGAIDNPTAIFEVSSPSTGRFDREGKFDAYRRLDSLRDYVLISSDSRRVEVYSLREDGTWSHAVYLSGSVARVPSVGVELSLRELYEEAAIDETSSPETG